MRHAYFLNFPCQPAVIQSLARLGAKLRLDVTIDLNQWVGGSWIPSVLSSLPRTVGLEMCLFDVPDEPEYVEEALAGLDRLPGLRRLDTQSSSHSSSCLITAPVPQLLLGCRQLTLLRLHTAHFDAADAQADAGSAWRELQHLELDCCTFGPRGQAQRLPEALCSLTRLTCFKLNSNPERCPALELPPALSQLR